METRRITVVSTKNQSKKVIMSAATTLGELKADFRQNGIDYSDMTFYEGISKTELKDDASILPHDIPYKGVVTNELVFMLTNTNKKIKSGADMSRSDIYVVIKSNGLQDECVRRYGKNFTMCKTVELMALINEVANTVAEADNCDAPTEKEKEFVDHKARKAIYAIIDKLEEDYFVDYIRGILDGTVDFNSAKNTSPYSSEDIEDMFRFVEQF